MRLLENKGIKETRFTNISYETALRARLQMQEGTCAIMLEFFKPTELADGLGGTIPIKIIIPNVPNDEKRKNQAYRIFYWYLKTKFEAVETGMIEFEQEFMPAYSHRQRRRFRERLAGVQGEDVPADRVWGDDEY